MVERDEAGFESSLVAALCLAARLHSVRACVASEPLPRPAPACLVILIDAKGIDFQRHILSYWVQRRPGRWQPERGDSEEMAADATELAAAVQQLIDRAEVVLGKSPGDVMLEFVLPVQMLNEAVDWWSRDPDGVHSVPLCLDYPVVLHSAPVRTHWAPAVRAGELGCFPASSGDTAPVGVG